MTTNLHDKMLAAIDAYFSASDGDERDQAEEQLLDVRDEILKRKRAEQSAREWVGLTVDEMLEALTSVDPATQRLPVGFSRFACALEAKLKEKNHA